MVKILIVEDYASLRQLLKKILHLQFPLTVIEEAADGNEVLKKVDTFLPDLIFMDIKLPGENGIHLTQEIKKDHPEIMIAILTSYDSPGTERLRLNVGPIGLLPRAPGRRLKHWSNPFHQIWVTTPQTSS